MYFEVFKKIKKFLIIKKKNKKVFKKKKKVDEDYALKK